MPPKAEKKICMVPACEASSVDHPDRIFVSVPENKKREWLAMVGAESVYIHPTKRFFCCEEHFDVRRDIKDYDFFKLFGGRVKFEDHAYPFKNLGDVPEVTPPTIVTDGKRNTTDIYFPAPLPVTVVEEQPIAESELKNKAESNLWKEQRDDEEEIVFVDPLFTSDEQLDSIASNIKVDDEDDSIFGVAESKFDPNQMTWTESSSPVKQEEIVIKSEPDIKLEPADVSEDVRFDSSDSDFSDGDDDEDYVYEDRKSKVKVKTEKNSKTKDHGEEDEDDDDDDEDEDDDDDDDDEDRKPDLGSLDNSAAFGDEAYIPKNTSYKCQKCNNYYSSSSSLKRHEQTVHTADKDKIRKSKKPKPKPFKCDVCRKPFETLFRKNRHLVTHEEGRVRIIACRQCPERFTEYEEYQQHKVVHNKSFECDICHKKFTTKYFLKLHYPIHMETKPFQCDRCSRSFSQASTLRRHTYLHEAEKRFMCEICGKRFHAQFLVKMHILHTHTKVRNFMCSQCPKRFPSTTALNIHINVHHSEVNPYKCTVCEKTFNHPSALMRHRKLHTGICEFVCEHCNKRFVRSDHLKKHIGDVHSEKSFKCELCSFTFNKSEKLKKHARSHEKPVVKRMLERCNECHQPFTDHNKLLRHLEMFHNPSNPFRCDICLKRFSQQSALGRHMKLHTDQKKSFKCSECEKTFCRLDHIKTHTLTLHNPDNPYKCSTCRQTFSTQQSLDKHVVRAHETERTMLCEFCNKAFSKRYTLQRHIRNFHDSDSSGGVGGVVAGGVGIGVVAVDDGVFSVADSNYVNVQLNHQMISNKPELYIKEEPTKQETEIDGGSSDSGNGDFGGDDDNDEEDDDDDTEDDEDFSPDSNTKVIKARQMKANNELTNKNESDSESESDLDEDSDSSESDGYVPKNTNHKCLKCNKYCASSSSLKRHEQTVHTEEKDKLRNEKRLRSKPKPKPFKCDVCRKPFETLFRKNRHQVTHDEGRVRIIACRQCPERFTEYEEYQKHKVVHVKSFECDVCHKSFSTKYFLKLHYPIHMETKPFQCDRCSRSFSQASTLRRHIYLHEAEKKFMCELCGKRFHAQYLVKMHILHTHTEYRKYICSQCPKRFSSTTDLTIHTNVHHSEINPYKCETCHKTFTHPSALRRHHRKVHTGFGEFVCQHCSKRFVRADLMDKHINTVHTLKSIKCEQCPATFNTAVKLKKHARVHREPSVRPAMIVHRCMECHQPFNDQEKLARHLEMSHNPNNPFKCDVCLKRLSSQSALCRHMKLLHTMQTKSYKCDQCGKSFGRLEHFKNHTVMLHNPANEFKCGTCRQTYSTKQSLDKHITRVHETERSMLCQYCNKAFSKRYILQRHIRNFHDVESGISSGISYNLMGHQIDTK